MNRTIVLRHLANSSLAGQTREFRQPRVRLGRQRDNDVVFDPTLDRVVSGHHCEVLCDGDALYVTDPGSTNGTYVNGRRVQGRTPVSDRDQITLGDQGPAFAVSFATAAADVPRTIVGTVSDPGFLGAGSARSPAPWAVPAQDDETWGSGSTPQRAVGLLDAAPAGPTVPSEDGRTRVLPPSVAGPSGPRSGSAPDPVVPTSPRAAYSLEVPTPLVVAPPPPVVAPPPDRAASRASLAPPSPAQKTTIGMNTLMVELNKATRRERRRLLALVAPGAAALVVAGGVVWYLSRGSGAPELRTERVIVVPAVPPGAPIAGVGTASQTAAGAGNAPAPAFGAAAAPGVAAAVAATAPATAASAAPAVPAASPGTVAPAPIAPREWADVLGERKKAVYLVLVRSPGKQDSPQGTAWSAAPGLLATNAHVADLFSELGPNDTLVCRSNTNPPVDLRIGGVRVHPGYLEFTRLQAAYYPVDPDTGRPLTFPATDDAALLSVVDEDRSKQAKPLELADAAALANLKETAELAYIGYPQEGSIEGGVNAWMPEPHQFVGYLSRKTDVFLSAANDARSNFLQYTLIVQGGASGSPVFNRDGKVIGLVAGNDVVGRGSQGARIMVSGKSFGPRADVVRELLDGSAAAKLAPVAAEWRATFRERYDRADKAKQYAKLPVIRAELAFDITAKSKAGRGETWKLTGLQRVKTWTVAAADLPADDEGSPVSTGAASRDGAARDPAPPAREFTTAPLAQAGYYCVVLTTDNPDVTPRLAVPDADEVLAKTKAAADLKQTRATLGDGTPHAASYPIRRAAGDTLRFTVGVAGRAPGAAATFTATLYRAVAAE